MIDDEQASTGPGTGVLSVRDLVKRYDGAPAAAVDGISFELEPGRVLALLGPNGAGKTTVVEILAGLRERTSGEVRVVGVDPGKRDSMPQLRRSLGLVLQHTGHYRYLTVRETVSLHRSFHPDPLDVAEVLDLVGLTGKEHARVRQLSGGQQRRLDVATALVGRPRVVFLDEPTTGFDPAARRRAWDVIGALVDLGTSVLLTTHYMEEAEHLADDVVVLGDAGSIVGQGAPAEIGRSLRLGTVIRAKMPFGITPNDLPEEIRDGLVAPGRFELSVQEPAPALAALCSWALARGMQLEDLDVRAPRLEDSYLALTDELDQAP